MDVETWKVLWQIVFIAASVLFYGIVIAVAYKAFGDVVKMDPQHGRRPRGQRSRR